MYCLLIYYNIKDKVMHLRPRKKPVLQRKSGNWGSCQEGDIKLARTVTGSFSCLREKQSPICHRSQLFGNSGCSKLMCVFYPGGSSSPCGKNVEEGWI